MCVLCSYCCSVAKSCLTLCNPMDCSTPGFLLSFTISQSLLKLMSIESVMPSNCLILCCPLLLLPSISPSIRVFSNESALHISLPKYWKYSEKYHTCSLKIASLEYKFFSITNHLMLVKLLIFLKCSSLI